MVASFRLALRFDRGTFRLFVPIRLALGITIPLIVCLLCGNIGLGVSAALGAFVCGVSDNGEPLPIRARVMTCTSVALGLTALVGGLISEHTAVIIAISALVALACGYLAALGPNASVTGMLALVIFNIFAGGYVAPELALQQSIAVLCGGLLQTCLALAGWPFHRFTGIRGQLADVWRTISVLASGPPKDMLSPALPGQLVHTASGVRMCGAQGASRDWLQGLVECAEKMRLPLASISAKRQELIDEGRESSAEFVELTAFMAATSRFCRSIARALVVTPRRSGIGPALAEMQQAGQTAHHWAPDQIRLMLSVAQTAAGEFDGTLPLGHGAAMTYPFTWGSEKVKENLRRHFDLSSPIARHAIRLAIATPVAWVVGLMFLSAHQYWVALTVAWVTRPGYGLTVGRVVSRTLGTLLGLVLIGVAFVILNPGPWGMVAICAISGYVLFVFLTANYAMAVVFVTCLVVTLLSMNGSNLLLSLDNRALGTILGGIIALVASQVGAMYAGPSLAEKLALVAERTRAYAQGVARNVNDIPDIAAPLIDARQAATNAVEEAMLEPRHGCPLEPKRAERVLDALLIGIFFIAGTRQDSPDSDGGIAPPVDLAGLDGDLDRLINRLHEIEGGDVDLHGQPIPGLPPPHPEEPGFDAARAAVQRSIAYLGG